MTELILIEDLITNINNMSSLEIRHAILKVEERMLQRTDAVVGNSAPLEHFFGDGLYVRKITMPASYICTTRIHLFRHPAFIMSGIVMIIDEKGARVLTGPTFIMTEPKTKRIVICKTIVEWITVHHTHLTNIEDIENEVSSTSFSQEDLL